MRIEPLSFRFSGKIARLLGRESVSSPIVALFELIKNSYDADAKNAKVIFSVPENCEEASIEISDDGIGMNIEDFKQKWMVVGTDDKENRPVSDKGRRKIGEKGLGRFSIERLGRVSEITTKKDKEPEDLFIRINWEDFEIPGTTFDKVTHEAKLNAASNEWHGFRIIIKGLRDKWTKKMIQDFADEVSILTPPKQVGTDFVMSVICKEYMIHEENLDNYLFDEYKYVFYSEYDGESKIKYSIKGKSRYGITEDDININSVIDIGKRSCGKLNFMLYFYPLGSGQEERFYPEQMRQQISGDLKSASGIKIYRDGFRVKPYGDTGNDWLELSHKRLHIRNIKYPDNNQVIGYVQITRDTNQLITDTTTREGLIRNSSYYDMVFFLERSLWAFATFRNSLEKKEKSKFTKRLKEKEKEINTAVEKLNISPDKKTDIKGIIQTLVNDAKEEISSEKEQKDLYRNLATIGVTAGYSSHEIRPLIGRMRTQLDFLYKDKDLSKDPNYMKRLDNIKEMLDKNELFIDLVIGYIKKDKRQTRIVDLLVVAEYIFTHFSFILEKFGIEHRIVNELRDSNYKMFRIDFESILINMLLNSVYFLKYKDASQRKIDVEFNENEKSIFVRFHDSGPGVPPENQDKIFEPLFTTKENEEGTGLGLTIVKELMEYYGGSVSVEPPKLGGLSLLLVFPKRS
ncbi:MAG: sensor histidine kinase [Candidatus Methanoperedens sp.]|nr:sensor histidine kinase [Candidatus Methanoperedens sp.]